MKHTPGGTRVTYVANVEKVGNDLGHGAYIVGPKVYRHLNNPFCQAIQPNDQSSNKEKQAVIQNAI